MTRVARILRRAQGLVVRNSPTEATFYKMAHGAPNSLAAVDAPTISTSTTIRCVASSEVQNSEDAAQQPSVLNVLTIRPAQLSWTPSELDRVAVGGKVFAISRVDSVQGALLKVVLAGEAGVPSSGADVTPPTVSAFTPTTGTEEFTYTATFSEASIHRVRYRKPPKVGAWVTTAWNGSYSTSGAGTVGTLDAGIYETEIQARDAAGNVSDWFNGGNVTVTGVPE